MVLLVEPKNIYHRVCPFIINLCHQNFDSYSRIYYVVVLLRMKEEEGSDVRS